MKKIPLILFLLFFLLACNKDITDNQSFSIKQTSNGYILKIRNNNNYTYRLSRKRQKETVHIPVQRVIVLSSTHIGFISALGEENKIIGISGKKYVYNPLLCNRLDSIAEIGYENSINIEKILSLNPDVIFTYNLDITDYSKIIRLKQAGIAVVPIYEFLENNPLRRAQWIEVFGIFFDKYSDAKKILKQITESYNSQKKLIEKYLESSQIPKIKVLVNIPYRGVWYVPSGNSYMAQLIKDAGAYYPWAETNGNLSIPLDFETVFSQASDADILINPNTATTLAEVIATDKRLRKFKAIKNKQVYNFTKKISPGGGFAFWENGVIEPDKILHDLIKIFYPNVTFVDTTLYYYQKLQ